MLVVGAKGFAKELIETICQDKADGELVFYDDISDDLPSLLFGRFQIIRDEQSAKKYFKEIDDRFVLGIGSPVYRKFFFDKFSQLGGMPTTLISPFAKIGTFGNEIGIGSNILTNAVVETENEIGRGVLLHIGVLVSHETKIGDFSELSPYTKILGNVSVGEQCRLGTGCIVLPKVKIGNNVTVGAGAVVTKDVSDNMTVVGIPAKDIKTR